MAVALHLPTSISASSSFLFPSKTPFSFSPSPSLKPSLKPSKNLSLLLTFSSLDDTHDQLELLGKPSPPLPPRPPPEDPPKPGVVDDALTPFIKLFRAKEPPSEDLSDGEEEEEVMVGVQYHDPKPGDLAVGVVMSGNENRLDVNVGTDSLGTMLTKEVLPLSDHELSYLMCHLDKDAEEFMAPGKVGVLKKADAVAGEAEEGRPVVKAGTVVFAEVLGRTLSGRPLLSSRRHFRRVAWHRVRQIVSK